MMRESTRRAIVVLGLSLLVGAMAYGQGPFARSEPINLAPPSVGLAGMWQAYLQGFTGSLTVSIQQNGDRISGTVTGGSSSLTAYIPAGKMMFYGNYNAESFGAQQICAGLNYASPRWVNVTLNVIDSDHLKEDLVSTGPFPSCGGFPILWERVHDTVTDSSSPSSTTLASSNGCSATPSPQSAASPRVSVTIPPGTVIPIRMVDSIDSSRNHVGEQFAASVDAPVVVGDKVPIEKGADAWVQLVQAQSAGHLAGKSELQLELASVKSRGSCYDAVSSTYEVHGASRGKDTAKKVGGGAVLGALIGAVVGRGKGAAIGAAAGAGAGTAVQVLTHGQQIRVPSETKIDFTLQSPITVMLNP